MSYLSEAKVDSYILSFLYGVGSTVEVIYILVEYLFPVYNHISQFLDAGACSTYFQE